MEKVQTQAEVQEIFEAARKLRILKNDLYAAIRLRDSDAFRLRRQINHIRRSIREKYDVII